MRCFASYSPCFHSPILGASANSPHWGLSAKQVFTHYKKAFTCPKSRLCCLVLLVLKLPITGKIYPVRVLFHKLPLTCPTIHFQPLLTMSEKSFLWSPRITLSRFRTVRKQSLLWTPKTTLYDVQKPAQVLFKTVRKTIPLWTPKTL